MSTQHCSAGNEFSEGRGMGRSLCYCSLLNKEMEETFLTHHLKFIWILGFAYKWGGQFSLSLYLSLSFSQERMISSSCVMSVIRRSICSACGRRSTASLPGSGCARPASLLWRDAALGDGKWTACPLLTPDTHTPSSRARGSHFSVCLHQLRLC